MNHMEPANKYGYYVSEMQGCEEMRWTMQKTLRKIHANGNVLSFLINAPPQIIPAQFIVKINGQILDKVNLTEAGKKALSYDLPDAVGSDLLVETYVDKAFTPFKAGMGADFRNIGVGISNFNFSFE